MFSVVGQEARPGYDWDDRKRRASVLKPVAVPHTFTMAAFTGSPPPRRKNRPPSRQIALEPPPRRVGRFASSRPASRLPTPARCAEQSSYTKDDGTVGSMDVDEDTLQPTERGLRQDTVFAKSEELLVTFHGHLPAEAKHVLRNAGERPHHPCPALVGTLHNTFL